MMKRSEKRENEINDEEREEMNTCVGFIVSFLYERKPVKIIHAIVWGFSYFGGAAAFVFIVVDIAVSISISMSISIPISISTPISISIPKGSRPLC